MACDKENIDNITTDSISKDSDANEWTTKDVKVENGMMSFKNDNELYSFVAFIKSNSDSKKWLDAFEKETGFKSLRSHYINQLDQLNEILDKNENNDEFTEDYLYKFVNSNSKYWFIDESDPENRILTQIYDLSSNYLIANKNLQYKVGDKLRTINKNVANKNIEYFYNNESQQKIEGNCGLPSQSVATDYTKNLSGCSKDRRVELVTVVTLLTNPNTPSNAVEAGYTTKLDGQRKRFCIWVGYKTYLEVRNSEATLNVRTTDNELCGVNHPGGWFIESPSVVIPMSNFNSIGTAYSIQSDATESFRKPDLTSDTVLISGITFSSVKTEGSSQGTGGSWAKIDCDEND